MYFKNFPQIDYKFGENIEASKFQDLMAYIDIVDQVKDEITAYTWYNIQDGTRPDQVSQEIYGTPDYHWTFFLLNNNLRSQGWPLRQSEVEKKIRKDYPNTTLNTGGDLSVKFRRGSTVTGASSGATGTILRRRLDLGQIIISGDSDFVDGETITTFEDGVTKSITISSAIREWNSVHHFENDSGYYVDIIPDAPFINERENRYVHYDSDTATYDLSVLYNTEGLSNANLDSDDETRLVDVYSINTKFAENDPNEPFGAIHRSVGNGFEAYYNGQILGSYGFDSDADEALRNKFDSYITQTYDDTDPAIYTPITFRERLIEENNELREIKVLKPEVAAQIVNQFSSILLDTTPVEDVRRKSQGQQGLGKYEANTNDKATNDAIALVNSLLSGNS